MRYWIDCKLLGVVFKERSAYFCPSSRILEGFNWQKRTHSYASESTSHSESSCLKEFDSVKTIFSTSQLLQQAFLNRLSKLNPLYSLFQKHYPWQWGSRVAKSFKEAKEFTKSIYNTKCHFIIPNKVCCYLYH